MVDRRATPIAEIPVSRRKKPNKGKKKAGASGSRGNQSTAVEERKRKVAKPRTRVTSGPVLGVSREPRGRWTQPDHI